LRHINRANRTGIAWLISLMYSDSGRIVMN
jgi:hypothetical protein